MRIDDFVKGIHKVAISGHIRPDGDCIGSVLALYHYLKKNYPEIAADVYLEEPSQKFAFLPGFFSMDHSFEKQEDYDLMISLDCSTLERLGEAQKYFHGAKHTICLDHHESNPGYADENYIYEGYSSCCEVLYNYLDPDKLDEEIALCLYVGIISDTGVFKYPSTSPDTMRVAAHLMEFGIDTNVVIDECFYSKDYQENRILGYALQKSRLQMDGKVIDSSITWEEMQQFQVSAKELDGIVPQLRLTRGVDCAIFLYQIGKNTYKASLRSNEAVDVNKVAAVFGGGGHARAAGCEVTGELESCLEAISAEVKRVLA